MEWIMTNFSDVAGIIALAVLVFDRASKLTPSTSDDKIVAAFYRIFTILGVRVPDVK